MFHLRKEKSSVVYCKSTIYRGFVVPETGIEPARLYGARDFKPLVSTNSTTQALTKNPDFTRDLVERKTRLELATPTLARSCSTN